MRFDRSRTQQWHLEAWKGKLLKIEFKVQVFEYDTLIGCKNWGIIMSTDITRPVCRY